MKEDEVNVGMVVEWGPLDYPKSGIVRWFSYSGEYVFVEDGRGVYERVAVKDLRPPAQVEGGA